MVGLDAAGKVRDSNPFRRFAVAPCIYLFYGVEQSPRLSVR